MSKRIAKSTYEKKIAAVIDYVHEHLDDVLSLEKLASLACLSPFHWHRIYQGVTGESLMRTVRRLRLSRAAKILLDTKKNMESIATQAGYENVDSFRRKFKEDFGCTPEVYRKNGKEIILQTKKQLPAIKTKYDVEIITFEPLTLATVDHQGNYMGIGQAFEKVFAFGAINHLMNEKTRCFGLYYDDPNGVEVNKLRAKAGITVSLDLNKKNTTQKTIIERGKYATIVHKGPYAELENAYRWLFHCWFLDSGFEIANKPIVEEYLNNPREVAPGELLTQIYLPLL